MLSGEEDSRRVLDHVVLLARVAGDDGRGEDVVVVARGALFSKLVLSHATYG